MQKKRKKEKKKKKKKERVKKIRRLQHNKMANATKLQKKTLFAEDCVFINLPVNVIVSLRHRRSGDKHFYHPLMTNKSTIMT